MTQPCQVPFECYQGADFYQPLLWVFEINGCQYPLDISGYAVEMQVRITTNSSAIIVDISTANGFVMIDGPNGKIELYIPNAETSTIPIGCYVYDVRITNSVGLVERLFGGPFIVKEMVTQ